MAKDDLLISYFLKAHDFLKVASQAKFKGKQILTELYTQQIEAQSLINRINSGTLSPVLVDLYELALTNISKAVAQSLIEFEQHFMQKLASASNGLNFIEKNIGAKSICEYLGGQPSDKQADYWISLTQLRELVRNLSMQYESQTNLIHKKWADLSQCLLMGLISENLQRNLKLTKLMILHTSFQTEIEESTKDAWDQAITSLQGKRYK